MGDNYFDVDEALKDGHSASEVAAHLAQLHGINREDYIKDGLTDQEFLSEFKAKPLPGATAEPKSTAAKDDLSDVSNADNVLFGTIAAAAPGAAGYALNKLKGTALSVAGIKGVPSMDTSTTATPSKTFASPSQVSARVIAAGQPPRPEGPSDVVKWAAGDGQRTGQYARGYMGGADYELEHKLQQTANELEAKNPGYKIKPGTTNLLIPEAEYNKLVGEANTAKSQASSNLQNKAKMAAELRANRLAQINSSNIPAKIATNISNAPMAKRFMTGYNVGDLLQAQNPFEATVSTVGAAAPYGAGMIEKVLPQKYKGLAKLLGPVVSTAAPAINYLERKIIGPQEEPQQAEGGPVQGYAGGKAVKGALDFLAEKVAPTVKRAIGEFDPRFDPRVKEQPKLQNMILHEQNVGPKEISKIDLSKYEGHPFITGMSDRTAAGKNLMGVNDVMFNRPVALKGGQDFMFNSPHLWASAPSVTKQMMEHASALRDFTGRDPLFIPWQMAPTGSDYAHMTGQSMLAHAEAAMGKRDKNLLDKHMRQFIPEWKGIDHPESLEQFASASGPVRKAIQNTLDTNFRDRGALGIGGARLAITDPRQLNTPEGSIFNVGMFNPDAPRSFTSGHQSYPTAVPGQGLGQVDRNINIFQALPKVVQERGIIDPTKPGQTDLRALQMKPYGGILSEDVLRGMGYADGGEVEGYAGGKAVRHAISQIPEVAQALEAYLRGHITNAERMDILNKHLPIRKWNELPPNYTDDQIRTALNSDKQAKALADVPAGMQVGNRLDIPAYTQNGVYVDTVHNAKGTPISYNRTGHLQDVQFSSRPNQAARVGLGTKAQALTPMGAEFGSEKSPFALMKGTNIGTSDDEVRRMMQEYLNDPNWTQIGMDPRRNSQFYDKSTGLPVFSATEKLQSGPLVMVPKSGLETSHWADPRLQLTDERLLQSGKDEPFHYDGGGKVGALATLAKKILPVAEREANKAKYLENSVVKTPMYHGTSSDITEFKPRTADTIFVTSNPRFAQTFGDAHQQRLVKNVKDRMPDKEFLDIMRGGGYDNLDTVVNLGLPARQNIMPVHVNATNPFDYENPQHVESLFNELSKADGAPSTHSIGHGAWDLLELPHVQAGIKNLGHDSYFVQEGGQKNLGLYQPTQLKSAIGNEGTFNPLDPDITKADGGLMHLAKGGHATPAWQRSEGKNPEGGLNAAGRASYNREHGAHLKAPQPEGGSRRDSFCARMEGMKKKLTSSETAHDPDSRINKSLRKWKC